MRIKKRRCSRRPPQTMPFSRALYYNHKSRPMTLTAQFLKTCRRHQFHAQTPKKSTTQSKTIHNPHKKSTKMADFRHFLQFSVFDRPPLIRPDTNPDTPPHSTTKPSKAILEVYFYKLSGTLCYFFNFFQMLVCRFCNIFNIAFQCTGRIWVVFYRFDIRTTIRAL